MNRLVLKTLLSLCAWACLSSSAFAGGFIVTNTSGNLVVELISSNGGDSIQEFGIGTTISDRVPIFLLTLSGGNIASAVPSSIVDMGFIPSGSELHFYNISSWYGPQYAFSSNLSGLPSNSDKVVFLDVDNSLGLGGGVIEYLGVDHWMFHLDDAGSWDVDDDDNEMVVRLRINPSQSIDETPSVPLIAFGVLVLAANRGRRAFRQIGRR